MRLIRSVRCGRIVVVNASLSDSILPAMHRKNRSPLSTANRLLYAGLLLLSTIACDTGAYRTANEAEADGFLPHAVARLHSLAPGDITLQLSVNGQIALDERPVNGKSTTVSVDPGLLNIGENVVSVTFYYESSSIARRAFVTGTQLLAYDGSTFEMALSGLFYRYVDSDEDGIHDVHELSVETPDIDNDGLLNPDDSDSDDDSVSDGEDPTPWGPGSTQDVSALLAEIDVQYPNGSIQRLMIDQIVGGSGETARLAGYDQPLQMQFPPTWPAVVQLNPPETDTQRWVAYEWRVDNQGLCDSSRIPLDVSSMQLHSSGEVILYFERYTGPPLITRLASARIPDLDIFDHPPPFDGDGPMNDALRIALVPEYHTGWIDVWNQSNYTDNYCSVSLTPPAHID